jgi:hypothetical protein
MAMQNELRTILTDGKLQNNFILKHFQKLVRDLGMTMKEFVCANPVPLTIVEFTRPG